MSASKRLSWLLRHGADEAGLPMDPAGWVSMADLVRASGLSEAEILRVARDNDKGRLTLDGARIRACQGHSAAGTPVRAEALEASWAPWTGADPLWHGTTPEAARSIAREGILPGARTHVHLAPAPDSRVGKRWNTPVLLRVAPERLRARGVGIFQAENGVVLCRFVPPDCVVGVEGRDAAALGRLFGVG